MAKDWDNVSPVVNGARGILGAALGTVAGYFTFGWLLRYGFYAPAVPGVLVGLGAGVLIRRRSLPLAAVCAVLALGAGVFTRWNYNSPSVTLGNFLAHLHQLSPVTLVMLALGGLAGYWFSLGSARKRTQKVESDRPAQTP